MPSTQASRVELLVVAHGEPNVTWFPADVWPGLGMYFPRLRKRGLGVCPALKRHELELGRRRFHRKRST